MPIEKKKNRLRKVILREISLVDTPAVKIHHAQGNFFLAKRSANGAYEVPLPTFCEFLADPNRAISGTSKVKMKSDFVVALSKYAEDTGDHDGARLLKDPNAYVVAAAEGGLQIREQPIDLLIKITKLDHALDNLQKNNLTLHRELLASLDSKDFMEKFSFEETENSFVISKVEHQENFPSLASDAGFYEGLGAGAYPGFGVTETKTHVWETNELGQGRWIPKSQSRKRHSRRHPTTGQFIPRIGAQTHEGE